MALIAHLFGSPTLSGSVGKGGANNPTDVKIVKALLNVYRRSNDQPVLPMDTAAGDTLATHIESFQKEKLNSPKPDGRVDPGGKTLTGLLQHLRNSYTTKSVTAPAKGGLTWETEGDEGGRYHSRRLHVPDGNSGLTLGRGYDLRKRMNADVQADLANAGVMGDMAFKIGTASGKWGLAASQFVIDNDLLDYEITPQVQLKLFEKVYDELSADVRRISNAYAKKHGYMEMDWKKLDQRIFDVVVDLRYRGDYTEATRAFLQKHVVNNDFTKFKAEIAKKSNWTTVPEARFQKRKNYLETTPSKV